MAKTDTCETCNKMFVTTSKYKSICPQCHFKDMKNTKKSNEKLCEICCIECSYFNKSSSFPNICATCEECNTIKCHICNDKFLKYDDQHTFIRLCQKCDQIRYYLMHRLNIDEINLDYEIKIKYKVAEHTHKGPCDNPHNCKINIKELSFNFSILKSFDPDVKKNGSIINIYSKEMLYYRWPTYRSNSLSMCKCDYGSTLCVMVDAKIVKKIKDNIYKSLPRI